MSRGNGFSHTVFKKVSINDVDIRVIRERLSMTQTEFANAFGFSVRSLQNWETSSRGPSGATRAYLIVISRIPKEVEKALFQ